MITEVKPLSTALEAQPSFDPQDPSIPPRLSLHHHDQEHPHKPRVTLKVSSSSITDTCPRGWAAGDNSLSTGQAPAVFQHCGTGQEITFPRQQVRSADKGIHLLQGRVSHYNFLGGGRWWWSLFVCGVFYNFLWEVSKSFSCSVTTGAPDLFCSSKSTEESFPPFAKSHKLPQPSPSWGSPSATRLRNMSSCCLFGGVRGSGSPVCSASVKILSVSLFPQNTLLCHYQSEKLYCNQLLALFGLSPLLQRLQQFIQQHILLRLYSSYIPTTTFLPHKVAYNTVAVILLGNGRQL